MPTGGPPVRMYHGNPALVTAPPPQMMHGRYITGPHPPPPPGLLPQQYMPPPPPQVINFVPPGHYPMAPMQFPPGSPMPDSGGAPPVEVRGGMYYFNAETQQPELRTNGPVYYGPGGQLSVSSMVPPRRPKAAIPIINPQVCSIASQLTFVLFNVLVNQLVRLHTKNSSLSA